MAFRISVRGLAGKAVVDGGGLTLALACVAVVVEFKALYFFLVADVEGLLLRSNFVGKGFGCFDVSVMREILQYLVDTC